MKKWTHREALTGGTVEPDSINDELRAQQSSITTLDREQLPDAFVDAARLTPYAIQRVYSASRYPSGTGQPDTLSTSNVSGRMWLDSVTPVTDPGSWQSVAAAITLSAFAGGHLYFEWAGIGYVFPPFAVTDNSQYPHNPKYLNLRVLVNNSVLTEARGPGYHESFRVFGGRVFPAGDLTVQLQFRATQVGSDDPIVTAAGDELMQAHLYGMSYCAIGRFR